MLIFFRSLCDNFFCTEKNKKKIRRSFYPFLYFRYEREAKLRVTRHFLPMRRRAGINGFSESYLAVESDGNSRQSSETIQFCLATSFRARWTVQFITAGGSAPTDMEFTMT